MPDLATGGSAQAYPFAAAPPITPNDRYVVFLACLLTGYALTGKSFAYLGVPPLFIGEIVLILGCLALARTGCTVSLLTTLPSLAILSLMSWVLARTVPFVGEHGVDALRDSVIALYSTFAFIVIALLLEKPERLDRAVSFLKTFARFVVPTAVVAYAVARFAEHYLPFMPGTRIEIISLRAGELGVHLSAAILLVAFGFARAGRIWGCLVVGGVLLIATQNRGALLSILIPVCFGMIASGQVGRLIAAGSLAAALLGAAWIADLEIVFPRGARTVSAKAVVDNIMSVVAQDPSGDLDGTKQWRLNWWEAIQNYTVWGPYFWTGKGFGVNLAVADGYLVGTEHGGPLLRSPHNIHMTFLARAGVPGLLLWWFVCLAWFLMLARNHLMARRRGEGRWANLFLLLACYVSAILINASFDVALEGPMLGIWLWVVVGLGIGASMIYRAPSRSLGGARA